MSGPAKPLLFGYVRVRALAAGVRPADIGARFDAFATREGYRLAAVYVDQAHTAPSGFDALIEAVKRHRGRAIAVPTLEHLVVLGHGPCLDAFLRRASGAQVLVMDHEP
ncbi:MAG TPA: hypothetical protein VGJ41_09155 [Nocardioides sp.]